MKLAVFVSDYRLSVDTLERMKPEKMGVILVQNGVYHAAVKEGGKASSLLDYSAEYYAVQEDLDTRGIDASKLDSKVKVVTISDVVDLIFNDYEKTAWL